MKEPKAKKKRSASAIGRQNRARGGAYERWVAAQFRAVFEGARRGVGQARTGGDVPDVEGCGVYWVQTKSKKTPNLFDAIEQAEAELAIRHAQKHATCAYKLPLVVARRTAKSGDVVGIRLEHFIELLRVHHWLVEIEAARRATHEAAQKEVLP